MCKILAQNNQETNSENFTEKYGNIAPCYFCGTDTSAIYKLGTKMVWSHTNCIIHEHIMNRNPNAHYKHSYHIQFGEVKEF
jgi:hypothetical protein